MPRRPNPEAAMSTAWELTTPSAARLRMEESGTAVRSKRTLPDDHTLEGRQSLHPLIERGVDRAATWLHEWRCHEWLRQRLGQT